MTSLSNPQKKPRRGKLRTLTFRIRGQVPSKANMYRVSANGGLYSPPEVAAYSSRVADAMASARCKPLEGPVEVHVRVYPPHNRGDLGGAEKALLDAMQNWRTMTTGRGKSKKRIRVPLEYGAYHNDKQVVRLTLERGPVIADDPHCVVTVREIEFTLDGATVCRQHHEYVEKAVRWYRRGKLGGRT